MFLNIYLYAYLQKIFQIRFCFFIRTGILYIPSYKIQLYFGYQKYTMQKTCPVLWVFNFLSKRWMLLIIRSLNEWKETFWDIKRSVVWMSSRILSERLSELVDAWYADRTIINEKPLKIRYSITEKWKSLGQCVDQIDAWARANN